MSSNIVLGGASLAPTATWNFSKPFLAKSILKQEVKVYTKKRWWTQ